MAAFTPSRGAGWMGTSLRINRGCKLSLGHARMGVVCPGGTLESQSVRHIRLPGVRERLVPVAGLSRTRQRFVLFGGCPMWHCFETACCTCHVSMCVFECRIPVVTRIISDLADAMVSEIVVTVA